MHTDKLTIQNRFLAVCAPRSVNKHKTLRKNSKFVLNNFIYFLTITFILIEENFMVICLSKVNKFKTTYFGKT